MDLIKKMTEAVEASVVAQTSFTKLDVSLGDVTNVRKNYTRGFSVMPTTLEQQPGGVGFLFFVQGFDLNLFDKLAYRGSARQKTFDLYEELEKIFQVLYTVRVVGEGYEVLQVVNVSATAPVYHDNYAMLTLSFGAHYRRKNLFR